MTEHNPADSFRAITISGSPVERGRQYGEQLSGEIADTIAYYREIFNLPDPKILELAASFRTTIEDFNQDYMTEIDAIADAAGLDPLWLVALNSRTEILSHGGLVETPDLQATECTALCFPGSNLLGQTWDWGKPLEDLSILLRIESPDGPTITMITEPGIIGKIGMNSAGLGVCLNILTLGEKLDGVPIHILLRGILDCQTIDQAATLITSANTGKSSNVLVADMAGNCFDTEFAGQTCFTLNPEDGVLIHTNHYRGQPVNSPEDPLFHSSYARYGRVAGHIQNQPEDRSLNLMKSILSDRSNIEFPIFRPFIPHVAVKELGTVFTMVMDLDTRELHIRKGANADAAFKTYRVA